MSEASGRNLSVAGLFADRDARRRSDQEAAEQLQRRKEEELAAFRQRLENFQLTDDVIKSGLDRIRRAFERGESELMFSSFPCDFCTDGGRAVINAGVPPINKPSKEEAARQAEEPDWLLTMPAGVRKVHEYLETEPEAWRVRFRCTGYQLSWRQAGRYRFVLHLAEERPRSIGLGSILRRGV